MLTLESALGRSFAIYVQKDMFGPQQRGLILSIRSSTVEEEENTPRWEGWPRRVHQARQPAMDSGIVLK